MKWVEIISLRCATNIDTPLVNELLKGIRESDSATDTPEHLVEIRGYHHSIVETDLSIHIYWESRSSLTKLWFQCRWQMIKVALPAMHHSSFFVFMTFY